MAQTNASTSFAIREIHLSKIRGDTCQGRAGINPVTVDEYTSAIQAGSQFPPIEVFRHGGDYWLADGAHRIAAYRKARVSTVRAKVYQGGYRAALRRSFIANVKHGLRRTNADKVHTVSLVLADKEWSGLSSRQIAKMCGVSHPFVNRLRAGRTTKKDNPPRRARTKAVTMSATPRPNPQPLTSYRVVLSFNAERWSTIKARAAADGMTVEDWLDDMIGFVVDGEE